MNKLLKISVIICVFSLLSGCAAINRLLGAVVEKPTLHFQKVGIRDVSLTGMSLDLSWVVKNPNDIRISIDRLSYSFDVEGKKLTSGVQREGVQIEAGSSSVVTLPVDIRFVDLADSIITVLSKEDFAWLAEGNMGFDTPIGMVRVPFSREGRTALPDLPSVRISNAGVSTISLAGATVSVELELFNPNSFSLPLDSLSYTLSIAGVDVAAGNTRPPALNPGQQTTMRLPVQVSFSSAGQAVFNALQSGNVDVGLKGGLSSGSLELPLELNRRVRLR